MLNKFLLITLGGSGEKLARYLKQDVEQRLRRANWTGPIPEGWRWLCVDVAHDSDVITNDVPDSLGRTGTRIGLADSNLDYRDYHYKATSNPKNLAGLAGSLPDPKVELPAPFKGAGQRPQVGHVVGLAGVQKLINEIDRQMTALERPNVGGELAEVSRTLRGGAEGDSRTMVMIASSLGGGSGAGLLQLATEVVLNHPKTEDCRDDLMTVLFTPDIFSELSDRERAGVQANCLFTTSTLLNAYEAGGELSPALSDLLTSVGFAPDDRRRAAVTNFFVGRSNGEITFDHQDSVIKSSAKAVGRILVDETVVNGLEAHFQANRDGAPVSAEYKIVSDNSPSRAASSLGYASLSLGDQQLAAYASERLARAQLDTFLRGHRPLQTPQEQDKETIERIADEQLDWFLGVARLDRQGVLSDFYDRDELRHQVREQVRRVQEGIRSGKRKAEPGSWLKRIESAFSSYEEELQRERLTARAEKVENWCHELHDRLCRVTSESIGRHGAPVTAALLASVESRLEGEASELDRTRREDLGVKARSLSEKSRQLLTKVKARTLRSGDAILDESSEARGMSLFMREDLAYQELAADLLRGSVRGVVAPLRAAVERSSLAFANGEVNRHGALVESWSRSEVAPHLRPAPNQLLLVDVEKLPDLFEELLQKTVGKRTRNAEEQAVVELLTGGWAGDEQGGSVEAGSPVGGDPLIDVIGAWHHGTGAPASFELNLEIPDLRMRAEEWVRYRPGALSERLRLPIADWIREQPDRPEVFADAFEEALRCAAPMLQINPAVHLRVHGASADPPKLHVSTLPIGAGSPVHGRLAQTLREVGLNDGGIEKVMDGISGTRIIEISSFLGQPVEPVVVENVYRPIESDWRARTNTAMREQFCSYRRTRPLHLFVPISPAKQRQFAGGWIVAKLLGQLTDFLGDWDLRPISVWSPEGWLRFPPHLLGRGRVTDEADVLGRLLESLPLAITSFASEQYEELKAYMRILELAEDEFKELRQAVLLGMTELDSGFAGDTFETRRKRMLDRVNAMRREAESHRVDEWTEEDTFAAKPRSEAAELTIGALVEIAEMLEGLPAPNLDDDDEMEAAVS